MRLGDLGGLGGSTGLPCFSGLSFASAARWSTGIQMSPSPTRSWSEVWPGRTACFASSLTVWTKGSWISQVCALGRSGEDSQVSWPVGHVSLLLLVPGADQQ